MRFLIIDDSSTDRELTVERLKKEFVDSEFVQVSQLDTLDQAIEDDHFDIVLTDYQLNWTDGLQILNLVKQRYPDIPVVMVTGTGNEEIAVEGLRSGLSDYILKNHLEQLPQAVRESLEKTRLNKKYEEAIQQLRLSEERHREIFEQSLTAIFVITPQGNLLTCNPAFARIFGYSSVDEVGEINFQEFYTSLEAYETFINLIQQEKRLEYHETSMLRHDGEVIYVVGNISGTFDASGQLVEIRGYLFDNTEQKKLTEQLQQSQRLESIGLLVSGIAHDFNNMLAGILGYTQRSMTKMTDTHPLHDNLLHIHDIAARAAKMTHQLLAFSRRQVLEMNDVNLNTIVENLLSFFGKILADRIDIDFRPEPDLHTIHVDYGQIEQVLMNLCINAHDAMPEGGKLLIKTENISVAESELSGGGQLSHVPYVRLSVEDTGIGMNEQTRAHIFEPFFTTKEVGKGTGLGLAMVHGIVGQHNGHIDVESTPGKGTTFVIYLPAVQSTPVPVESSVMIRTAPLVQQEGKTILVVEDDPDIRYLMEDALSDYGYKVICAPNGVEGLELFQKNGAVISLIISDLITPKMSGKELYERVRQLNKSAKFLFVSGYQANQISQNFVLEKGFAFLPKPFDLDELATKVQHLIADD